MKTTFAKIKEKPHLIKTLSLTVILFVTFFSLFSIRWVFNLKTHYSVSQFHPKKHKLIDEDHAVKDQFELIDSSPHILLLTLSKSQNGPKTDKKNDKSRDFSNHENWTSKKNLRALTALTEELSQLKNVDEVISLANVESAITDETSFSVGRLLDIAKNEKNNDWVFKEPLITPTLISHTGRETAIYITPKDLPIQHHKELMIQMKKSAQKAIPQAQVSVGGPAAMRTQITSLLTRETEQFFIFSMLVAILILVCVFKGFSAVGLSITILFCANTLALAFMSVMGISFTVLSTTVPILVTITCTAITTHTLVHLGDSPEVFDKDFIKSKLSVLSIFRPLVFPHMLTALTTAVGFGTLVSSDVPLLKEYGISVAGGVLIAAGVTLILLPSLLMFFSIPRSRHWIRSNDLVSNFVTRHSRIIFAVTTISFVLFMIPGSRLSWTARLFNDLPSNHETKKTTDHLSQHLGGVIPFEVSLGGNSANWKDPENIKKLSELIKMWRKNPVVGNVVGLPDFVQAAHPEKRLARSEQELAEVYFIYGMSEKNPIRPFFTANEKYTRISFRLHDVPADQMKAFSESVAKTLKSEFPELTTSRGGIASVIHPIHDLLSLELMLGFFDALFWILILLTIVFRSVRWALVAVIPNALPPIVLLGVLSLTNTAITPVVATIFAVSLGIAFDNTVYILGRLRHILKQKNWDQLPIRELLRTEANPCIVTSLSLMAGFSLFLVSYFNMNKVFGFFMLLSIITGLVGDLLFLPATLRIFPRLLPLANSREKIVAIKGQD